MLKIESVDSAASKIAFTYVEGFEYNLGSEDLKKFEWVCLTFLYEKVWSLAFYNIKTRTAYIINYNNKGENIVKDIVKQLVQKIVYHKSSTIVISNLLKNFLISNE